MDQSELPNAKRFICVCGHLSGILHLRLRAVTDFLLFSFGGCHQSFPTAAKCYRLSHQEWKPALDDGHAGHHYYLHLQRPWFYLCL